MTEEIEYKIKINQLKDTREKLYLEIRHLEYQIKVIDTELDFLIAKENLTSFEADLSGD